MTHKLNINDLLPEGLQGALCATVTTSDDDYDLGDLLAYPGTLECPRYCTRAPEGAYALRGPSKSQPEVYWTPDPEDPAPEDTARDVEGYTSGEVAVVTLHVEVALDGLVVGEAYLGQCTVPSWGYCDETLRDYYAGDLLHEALADIDGDALRARAEGLLALVAVL